MSMLYPGIECTSTMQCVRNLYFPLHVFRKCMMQTGPHENPSSYLIYWPKRRPHIDFIGIIFYKKRYNANDTEYKIRGVNTDARYYNCNDLTRNDDNIYKKNIG